jgi:hypothetical protein
VSHLTTLDPSGSDTACPNSSLTLSITSLPLRPCARLGSAKLFSPAAGL